MLKLWRKQTFPPTFYSLCTRDPFYRWFIQNANTSRLTGEKVEEHVFDVQPHGFGIGNKKSNWIPLRLIFEKYLQPLIILISLFKHIRWTLLSIILLSPWSLIVFYYRLSSQFLFISNYSKSEFSFNYFIIIIFLN